MWRATPVTSADIWEDHFQPDSPRGVSHTDRWQYGDADTVAARLREAGFDFNSLATALDRKEEKCKCVVQIGRSTEGKLMIGQIPPCDTAVYFEGLQVPMENVTLLVDMTVAVDWGLINEGAK